MCSAVSDAVRMGICCCHRSIMHHTLWSLHLQYCDPVAPSAQRNTREVIVHSEASDTNRQADFKVLQSWCNQEPAISKKCPGLTSYQSLTTSRACHICSQGTPPAQRTYNTIIIACNTCGQPQQALQMYCRMLADNVPPNSTTCNALISAYGKTRNLASALAVYQDMITRGMDRSVITYSSLISACEKAGDWRMALNVFDDMRGQGCAPNTITFNSLITACAQGANEWQGRGGGRGWDRCGGAQLAAAMVQVHFWMPCEE